VRFLIFSAAIVLPAAMVIIATTGRMGEPGESVDAPAAVSDPDMWPEPRFSGGKRLKIRYVCVTIFQRAAPGGEDHRADLVHAAHQFRAGLDRTRPAQYDVLVMAIRCSRVFTGEHFGEGPATVLLDQEKIVGVETGHIQLNESWQVAEYPTATVLPGLIDTHVHLVADSEVGALDRVSGLGDEELDAIITDGLQRQLAAGVTTVRDLGDLRYAVVNRRDVQRAGKPREPEPTIVASGPPLTSVGGHCHFLGGEVANRDQISAAMRERAQRGVDVIKVMASGGMTTPGSDVMGTQFSADEMRSMVELAHDAGLPITAHAHPLPASSSQSTQGLTASNIAAA
jgi:dihydroorotase-like cyclic amidohydrolase